MAFGNNTTVEYDIKINSKPAEKSIKDVEDAQEDLDKTVTSTSKNISMNWKAMGVAAAVAIGAMMKESLDLERALFGLNEQTKEYIKQASNFYGISQNIIANFVQTGKSAGMAGDEISKMIDMAIALGRAFPDESTESFVDNLVQLNRTGEAQGYITDILLQKYGNIDLKTISLSDKMEVLKAATKGVNKEFDKTRAAQFDKTIQTLKNETIAFGDALWDLADSSGAIWAVQKGLLGLQLAANGYAQSLALVKSYSGIFGVDTEAAEADLKRLGEEATHIREQLGGSGGSDRPNNLGTIDIVGKAKPPIVTTLPKSVCSSGGTASSTADREREIALRANERFWDDYNQTIMDATEYELSLLNERYTEYAKYVTDKVALEEWFSTEQDRIMEEDRLNTDLYADLKMRTFDDMADAITDFALTGEADFKAMADSIISEIIRINAQQLVSGLFGGSSGGGSLLGGIVSSIFGGVTASAKGNAFNNGSITAFASGGVVNSPTTFPMSGGTGLMGEAGSEMIAPIQRMSNGDMGVGAVSPSVNVNVNNYGNDEVSVSQNGDSVDIIITQIANGITRGTSQVGSAIESRYSLRKN